MDNGNDEFGIALCFDRETEERLTNLKIGLQRQLTVKSLLAHYARPHLTLGIVRGGSLDQLEKRLKEFAADRRPVQVELHSLGLYSAGNEDIFLNCIGVSELRNFHRACLESLLPDFSHFERYHSPEHWLPHCTLIYALAEPDFLRTVKLCRQSDIFGPARLQELTIIDVKSESEVCCIDLK